MFLNTGASQDGHIVLQRGLANKYQVTAKTDNSYSIYGYPASGEVFNINSSGHVTNPKQPSFRAGASSGYSGSGTVIVFNTVRHNIGNHYNSSNGRFVAPVGGVYYFGFQGISGSSSTSSEQNLTMYVNGVAINDTRMRGYTESSGHMKTVTVLSANDYVEMKSAQSTDWHGNNWQCFSGYLLG